MRKKKAKVVIAPVCDFCGQRSETFVVNAEHKTFCLIQTPGYPAEKDCMDDYIRRNKNAKTLQKEKESSLAKMNTLIEIIAITWLATGILLPLIVTTYYK